jgi:hypothetical protein
MSGAPFTPAELITLMLLGVLVVLVGIMGVRAWKRARLSPEEIERRRRHNLATRGKLGDANIVEMRGDFLVYTYAVRGTEYTASQDISSLKRFFPTDPSIANDLIFVKYDPGNPANSIVLAEHWSGLRMAQRR